MIIQQNYQKECRNLSNNIYFFSFIFANKYSYKDTTIMKIHSNNEYKNIKEKNR